MQGLLTCVRSCASTSRSAVVPWVWPIFHPVLPASRVAAEGHQHVQSQNLLVPSNPRLWQVHYLLLDVACCLLGWPLVLRVCLSSKTPERRLPPEEAVPATALLSYLVQCLLTC